MLNVSVILTLFFCFKVVDLFYYTRLHDQFKTLRSAEHYLEDFLGGMSQILTIQPPEAKTSCWSENFIENLFKFNEELKQFELQPQNLATYQ